MLWELVGNLAAAFVGHAGMAAGGFGGVLLLLGNMYDGIQGRPDQNGFWSQFGNGDPAGMTGATSMGVNYTQLLQAAGFENGRPLLSINPAYGNGYRSTNYVFTPHSGAFSAGGLGGGAGSGGASGGAGGGSQGIYSSGFEGGGYAGGSGAAGGASGASGGASQGSWLSNLFGGGGGTGAGMSTADWVRLGAGAVGAYGSYADSQARNAAARANSGPQNYSSQSSNNPYGPSVGYRDIAMQQALALLQGGQGQGGGGRGGRGGGGGGGAGYQSDWGGSQALADAMRERAMNGDPNVNANAQYMQNALNDPYGGSALLGRTFERADGLNNGAVDQFVQNMMGEWGGGGAGPRPYGGGSGGGGRGISAVSSGGGGGGGGHKLVGVAGDIRGMLDADYTANPELQAMIDQVNRGTTESYQRGLAGLSGQSEASGMYGSSDHQLADAQAAQGFARGLAENETGIRYQDFGRWRDEVMQAMGLGTQYDLGMAGIDAQAEASRNSTAASASAAANSNALQRELGNRGLMLQAMGLQNDMSQFGLGTMQNLSGMDVQNRQFMLGAGLDYGNFDMGQMGTAFGANFGLDQAQNADAARQAQMRQQASQQAWQRQQQAQNQPWNNLARYMDIINGASSGYGTSQESGVRPGTQQPESNNWLAAIQGGLGAAQSANNIYRGWNQGMGA